MTSRVRFAPRNTVHAFNPHSSTTHYDDHYHRRPTLALGSADKTSPESPRPNFLICAELGLLLRSRRLRHTNTQTLMDEISSKLREANIPTHILGPTSTTASSTSWTLTEDLTIPRQPQDHRFGVKLVSPYFFFGPPTSSHSADDWIPLFDIVFSTLNIHFELTTHHTCGTHIHVIPARGYWTMAEAKGLASTSLYFEGCFDALVPYYRRRSVFAKSNRHNRYMGRRNVDECIEAINKTDSFPALAARMNWCAVDSPTGDALGEDKDFTCETFRWNFQALDKGGDTGRGTIEFRQPPGVTDSLEAVKWIVLVGCFARLSCAFFVMPKQTPSMEGLGKWIRYEARGCFFSRMYIEELKRMFERADPVNPKGSSARDAEVISADEAARLRWVETEPPCVGRMKLKDWARHQVKRTSRVA
ncbi:hypothetical protein OQA88_11936 [Cercophora sp. LCS_1]